MGVLSMVVLDEREREAGSDLACARRHLEILLNPQGNPWLRRVRSAQQAPWFLHRAVLGAPDGVELSALDLVALCVAEIEGQELGRGVQPGEGLAPARRMDALAQECDYLARRYKRLVVQSEVVARRRGEELLARECVAAYGQLPDRWRWRVLHSLAPEPGKPLVGGRPVGGGELLSVSRALVGAAGRAEAERDLGRERVSFGGTGARVVLARKLAADLMSLPLLWQVQVMRRLEWGVVPADALRGLARGVWLHTHGRDGGVPSDPCLRDADGDVAHAGPHGAGAAGVLPGGAR